MSAGQLVPPCAEQDRYGKDRYDKDGLGVGAIW